MSAIPVYADEEKHGDRRYWTNLHFYEEEKDFFFHLWFKRSNETKYFLQNHILQTKAGLLMC